MLSYAMSITSSFVFFFFNDTATTEIYTLSLHDALPIYMGFLISFAGNSTYPKTQNLRDVAKALPLEKILIETDAPYLAPQPYRGKRNEPAYVAEVEIGRAHV